MKTKRYTSLAGIMLTGALGCSQPTSSFEKEPIANSTYTPVKATIDDKLVSPLAPEIECSINRIHSLPAWNEKRYDAKDIAELNAIASELRQLQHSHVLKVFQEYLKRHTKVLQDTLPPHEKISILDHDAESRLYVVMRAYFNIPDHTCYCYAKSFGGWIRNVSGTHFYDLHWPVQKNKEKVIGVAEYQGYSGASYDAIGEFEYFSNLEELHNVKPIIRREKR